MANFQSTPTRRRWLPRFGLRSLLIAVTAICIVLGVATAWFQAQLAEYHREQEIVTRIENVVSIGQHIEWRRCNAYWESDLPSWLQWMQDWPISTAFQRVNHIFIGTGSTPDILCILDELPDLPTANTVSTHQRNLTPEVVTRLAHIKSIRKLNLNFATQSPNLSEKDVEKRMTEIRQQLPGVEAIEFYSSK
jgi:hypothetical protein